MLPSSYHYPSICEFFCVFCPADLSSLNYYAYNQPYVRVWRFTLENYCIVREILVGFRKARIYLVPHYSAG